MGNEEAEIVNSTVRLTCGQSLLLKLGGAYVLVTAAPPAPGEPAEAHQDHGKDPLVVDLEDWVNQPPVEGPGTEPSGMPMIASLTAGTLKLDLDPLVGTLQGQPLKDATSLRSLRVGNRMQLIVPARVPGWVRERIQSVAIEAFQRTGCSGLARVDFFVEGEHVLLNELNTMPGFTATSVFASLFEASGVPYAELLDRLVQLAFERHAAEQCHRH